MQNLTVQELRSTTSESEAARFVCGFSAISNIAATGRRRHLLGVRVSYLFEVSNTSESSDFVASMQALMQMVQISHKAFNNSYCSNESMFSIFLLNVLLGITNASLYTFDNINVPMGEAVRVGVSVVLPWAPGAYGDANHGIDPWDGCADLSMFANQGEVTTQLKLVPLDPDEDVIAKLVKHAITLDILETSDLYVFQPQQLRSVKDLANPVTLNGDYRKIQALFAQGDIDFAKLTVNDIQYTADGRPVFDSVPAHAVYETMFNTAGDLRAIYSLRHQMNQIGAGMTLPGEMVTVPPMFPIVNRNHSRGLAQLGPAGSTFTLKGVPAFMGKEYKFVEYSFGVRDFSQFAEQIARAGLDTKVWTNDKIVAGSKRYNQIAASGDEAIGMGLRYPNVTEQKIAKPTA
jgi:hypothetical protein